MAKVHHFAKFRQNQLHNFFRYWLFRFFKMAAVRHCAFVWGVFGPPT